MKKIIFFPKYSAKAPSSRYRIYSYLNFYKKANFDFEVFPLLDEWYLDVVWQHKSILNSKFIFKLIASYLKRFIKILFIPQNSFVYIGADLFPLLPPIFELYLKIRGIKYLIEFDDAIFHNYDHSRCSIIRLFFSKKMPYVIKNATYVICGSSYLVDFVKKYNQNVTLIPTCVDGNRYIKEDLINGENIIGWIGSSNTSKEILEIIPALREVAKFTNFSLHLIGFDRVLESRLSGINYKIIDWTKEEEITELNRFSIGIMPLRDLPFNRGKCAFKLVQYMMLGIPTVSSPLQSNIDIDAGCGNYFADSNDEWKSCLINLLNNKNLRDKIGMNNLVLAKNKYTFEKNKDRYIDLLSLLTQ